jgi:chemotaxis protein MotB
MRLSYDNGLESSSGITNDAGFFVSFADMMTLLMVFFVLMYSVSKVDEDRFDEVARSVSQAFNEEVAQEIADEVSQLENLQASLDETIKMMNLGDEISTEMTASGLKIELASNLMFGAGSADLKGGMDSTIKKLGEVIMELPTEEYTMLIEGHTDNQTIN